jgi:amino-acid N-acetyltransferase
MSMNTTMLEPTVRAASASDLPGIEALLAASSLPTDGVKEALPGFLIATAGNDVVGVAGLEVCCDNALLRSVAVAPGWRSKGLGRTLVNRLIADAESRGIHALYLLTTTAERYFPSFGFSQVARERVPEDIRATAEFTSACPASATVMARPVARATATAS